MRRPTHAFTLVELLVVIGIIALLISILLPALAKARQQANRAACLSNLRQVHQAFMLYAHDHRDPVPLGYRAGAKQFNSMLYSPTAVPSSFPGLTKGRFVLFGHLYQRRLMADGRAFYCPAENNPTFMYDVPKVNPWPRSDAAPPGDGNTQVGYSLRPEVEIPDDLSTGIISTTPAGTTPGATMLPRLTRFKNKAIVADLTASKVRVDTRHVTGMNALFGDGSAVWIPRKQFNQPLSELPEPAGPPDKSPETAAKMTAVWAGLDQR